MNEQKALWVPQPEFIEKSNLRSYERWLAERKGLTFDGYADMWRWSTREIDVFWESVSSAKGNGLLKAESKNLYEYANIML